MKKLLILILFALKVGSVNAQKQKAITYQLMEPNFNHKVIEGKITEIYTTQRYGKTFNWVKIGKDTIIHVWQNQIDTTTMKVGLTMKFNSIKKLSSNLWKKEKSD